jgi:hypothetical protein
VNWIAIGFAGFVGTIVALAFFWLAHSLRWTSLSPAVTVGCLFTRQPRAPITETIGFAVILILGTTLLPALFQLVLAGVSITAWIAGTFFGIFLGLVTAASMPLYGMISACVRAGVLPAPGKFGLKWGRPTPAVLSAGLAIYGGVAGAILGAF